MAATPPTPDTWAMDAVTEILEKLNQGDSQASEKRLPFSYEALRKTSNALLQQIDHQLRDGSSIFFAHDIYQFILTR